MTDAFYGKLNKTVPEGQRNFATRIISRLTGEKDCLASSRGRKAYNRVRYRQNVPYSVLGAAVCRGILKRR